MTTRPKKERTFVYDPTVMISPNIDKLKGIIGVQGLIGAGKTEVLTQLKNRYPSFRGTNILYLPEPSDIWTRDQRFPEEYGISDREPLPNYLKLFYKETHTYAFPFQVYAYCTRTGTIHEAIREIVLANEPTIIVSERGLESDKHVFTKNLIETGVFPLELVPIYDMFWNMLAKPIVQHNKAFIHLNVEVETCVQRMNKRNRSQEKAIPESYLRQLDNMHTKMYDYYSKIPVFNIDWNGDKDDPVVRQNLYTNFEHMLLNTFFSA